VTAVYLAARVETLGDLARLSLVADGVHALHGLSDVRHPRPGDGSQARSRLILGDECPQQHPVGPLGPGWIDRVQRLARVAKVWRVGQEAPADVAVATRAGIAVDVLDQRHVAEFEAAGRAVRDRGAPAAVPTGDGFSGARAVVHAYFRAETWQLGGGGIDPARRLGSPGSGGSGGVAFRASVERTALEIVAAASVVREAGLSEVERGALLLREVHGHTWRRVAQGLGWEDDGAAERRAGRTVQRGLRRITVALRDRESAAPT